MLSKCFLSSRGFTFPALTRAFEERNENLIFADFFWDEKEKQKTPGREKSNTKSPMFDDEERKANKVTR